jgi:hypothetical protein
LPVAAHKHVARHDGIRAKLNSAERADDWRRREVNPVFHSEQERGSIGRRELQQCRAEGEAKLA